MNNISTSLDQERQNSDALNLFFQMKDANLRRHADVEKLRSLLQNLGRDIKLCQVSHKLKMDNIMAKIPSQIEDTAPVEKSGEASLDSDQMINE